MIKASWNDLRDHRDGDDNQITKARKLQAIAMGWIQMWTLCLGRSILLDLYEDTFMLDCSVLGPNPLVEQPYVYCWETLQVSYVDSEYAWQCFTEIKMRVRR